MSTADLSQTSHIKLNARLIRSWLMFAMTVAFAYTVLLQPYFDLLSIGLINIGRPQLIPIIFYLKPVFMLALILIFYVRWTQPVISAYFLLLAILGFVFLVAATRSYSNFSEAVIMLVLLALAFRPVTTVRFKLRQRLFRLYIANLAFVFLVGVAAYLVLDATFWSSLNYGQIDLYKSGAARSALTENFYGATFGERIVSFWGEPLAFGYSIVPLFMFVVVKYRQTGRLWFLFASLVVALGLLLSTRLAFGVSVFTAAIFWLYSYPGLRRYFPIVAIPLIAATFLAGLVYISQAYHFDASTRDRVDSFVHFLRQVELADLFGFAIGKFTNYNPLVGYQEAPEIGLFRFVTGLGLPLALLVLGRFGFLIERNFRVHRVPEAVMACTLMAYLLSLLIAPQFFTVKTLYPFAAVWFLVMANYE